MLRLSKGSFTLKLVTSSPQKISLRKKLTPGLLFSTLGSLLIKFPFFAFFLPPLPPMPPSLSYDVFQVVFRWLLLDNHTIVVFSLQKKVKNLNADKP